ncbi:MAG: hypothetical protein A2741_01710 [Candidatus Zambryskibacteria bacterium RIFCSPHIGHO2_01_FULL_43_27]|uniref:Uncharacterized protein n=1 Tax=Candidatus Zambryskibacteria bacterium RIFCSPLOWO2_01_FULL_43_17 TaxID=1802760 RepID=A0A1G2U0D5_9BACT|nr:MAG: hypothetical protein A2741_01710 [Candidatus Zambryskibacteria bacterium RIFCSPHIGHO2_01_FULL_43_27]OHB00698.1 MAG: hypothetical protein A3E93_03050 [Candidatus Zambryskibacteria bacterium RIFCSPHIGHO2_12_FULL_43_12b]OHB02998.1 MAG: hypothetical protein A2920_02915 [Candidatus Zambryskibacteria bacterium RIFCSPLOWO2_01_FULL_43_17]
MATLGNLLARQLQSRLGALSATASASLASIRDELASLVSLFGEKAIKLAVNGRGKSRYPILAYLLAGRQSGKRVAKPSNAAMTQDDSETKPASRQVNQKKRKKTKKTQKRRALPKRQPKKARVKNRKAAKKISKAAPSVKKAGSKGSVQPFKDTKDAILRILRGWFTKERYEFSTSDVTRELRKEGIAFHQAHPGVVLSQCVKNLSRKKGRVPGSTRDVYIYTMESEPAVGKAKQKK